MRAPGRVNLIGDHTDYNDGFVLPIAIDRDTHVAFRPRADGEVRLVSEHGPLVSFDLAAIRHDDPPWGEYVRGVAWAMDVDPTLGFEGAVASDVPIGAGLSSSAALELAMALIFASLGGDEVDPVQLALVAQSSEREWVGLDCGIMDQLSVAAGASGQALLIDCRSLEIDRKPVSAEASFVVLDTNTRRELTSSAYNERRATCERAAALLGVPALRDLITDDLSDASAMLDELALRRARHVVTENARVLAAAAALDGGDLALLGRLMTESHRSLRDDYEASSRELDAIVAAALNVSGCLGARMTGAGFGGCAVALVERSSVDEFVAAVAAGYFKATGITAEAYACVPAAGAALVTLLT